MHYRNTGNGPKSGHNYLVCSAASSRSGCEKRPIRYEEFERSFVKNIRTVDYSSHFFESGNDNEISNLNSKLRNLDKEKGEIILEIRNLVAAVKNGGAPDSIVEEVLRLERRKSEIEIKASALTSDLDSKKSAIRLWSLHVEEAKKVLDLIGKKSEDLSKYRFRAAQTLMALIEKIEITKIDGVLSDDQVGLIDGYTESKDAELYRINNRGEKVAFTVHFKNAKKMYFSYYEDDPDIFAGSIEYKISKPEAKKVIEIAQRVALLEKKCAVFDLMKGMEESEQELFREIAKRYVIVLPTGETIHGIADELLKTKEFSLDLLIKSRAIAEG